MDVKEICKIAQPVLIILTLSPSAYPGMIDLSWEIPDGVDQEEITGFMFFYGNHEFHNAIRIDDPKVRDLTMPVDDDVTYYFFVCPIGKDGDLIDADSRAIEISKLKDDEKVMLIDFDPDELDPLTFGDDER